MRTIRRSHLLALVALVALLVAACGDDNGAATTTTASGAEDTTTTTGATTTGPTTTAPSDGDIVVGLVYDIGGRGDQSFNDAAARGLDQAKSEFGVDAQELEPATGGENRDELLRLLSQEGVPLIFAVGFAFADGVEEVAPNFPDTIYGLIDSVVEEPNVASLIFAEHEGSFLVGAAAALASESDRIGFIGGVEVDLIKRFEAGYVAGARHINPDIQIDITYISQVPDFSGFNDPARARVIAEGMYDDGADVVYHAAGGSGSGLFDAAVAAGAGNWAIGVDSDQYLTATPAQQAHILTSMLKRVDVAVFETISALVAGTLEGGITLFDLASGGIDYSTSGGHIDEFTDELDQLKADIIAGTITVPES